MQFEGSPFLQDLCSIGGFGGRRDCTKRIRAFEAAWARLQSDEPGWALRPIDRSFQDALVQWLTFHKAILIGELIPLALEYLRNNPASPDLASFDHVLVDEYQDLNKAEQVLIDLLSNASTQTLVGDPDQSIYSFRFAHPIGIISFGESHQGTHDEALVECRRCPSLVVTIADHLIRHNYHPTEPPRLLPLAGNPVGEISIVQWTSLTDEANGIAKFCHYLVRRRDYSPSEILILTSRKLLGYGIRDALRTYDIDAHSFYNEEILDSREAQEHFALLTLLSQPDDRIALRFLLGLGSPSWNSGEYERLRAKCNENGLSPWRVLEGLVDGTFTIVNTSRILNRFLTIRGQLENIGHLRGYALIDALFPTGVDWSGPAREAIMLRISQESEPGELFDFLLRHVTQPEMPEEGAFVRVMSLHKSKGLTSKVVIVGGCIEGLLPTLDADHTPDEAAANLEEQRRLFYVAITRCREVMVLSSVTQIEKNIAYKIGAKVRGSGLVGRTITSRFVNELGPNAPRAQIGERWIRNGFAS
jgi:superfamily I DNA/RNA helicase